MSDPGPLNDASATSYPALEPSPLPSCIGRYRVERLLGQGGFGVVYLAHDDDLQRRVAVKMPQPSRLARPGAIEAYLAEARSVAALDHPHIVPVYDFGRTDEGLCYIVSRYVAGGSLADLLHQRRLAVGEATALVAAIAEALHHAHQHRLVHRDVKPANILLDAAGKAYLTDFGIALRDEDFGKGGGLAGTPWYMSPEQARGESHRVDGRADVYSLGVVLYELLTGERPFRRDSLSELLQDIASLALEARPPRQLVSDLPRELERICLKALAKRPSDRYLTAHDFADDLRALLAQQPGLPALAPAVPAAAAGTAPATPGSLSALESTGEPTPQERLRRVIPKGLRAFDADDRDFFLELLPGPRDRHGLPDSVRFWKQRIEATDPERAFAVGLLYGPSGCGKSSLMRAGLLPRLGRDVVAVYVEAAAGQTEARLLRGLARHCPGLDTRQGLAETLAALRRGEGPAAGGKVLLVLDQFEQFLHAHGQEGDTELARALRQCDGVRLQCLLLVRDDFWLAVSRFLRELEVRLLEGHNSALVDLFDPDHAKKVLTAFGRAYGKWPQADSLGQDPALQSLVGRLDQLSDQFAELREGVHKALLVADVDPEMALTRARKVLEYVLRDVYERRLGEPAGTRPLENLLQRLVKDGHFPDRLDAYANTIRKLGNVGTHGFGEKLTAADLRQSLGQLKLILQWYVEEERPEALVQQPARSQPLVAASRASSAVHPEQERFVEEAIAGLAQEGKVICVRLALFAEMMKGKAWTAAALKAVGGTEGVGVTFLEETFSAATAPPEHRYHQRAARAVLKALLPEAGSDIKGHMRSQAELLATSGYASRPKDFDDLIGILDRELRLITPTDPEGQEGAEDSPSQVQAGEKYYQLTHDYLVHSLRDWLTRKQKQTRRGRAQLRLAERAALWQLRRESRHLPAWWEWLNIRLFTRPRDWTAPQQRMMRQAGRYHARRGLMLLAGLLLLGWGAWEGLGWWEARNLQRRLLEAAPQDVHRVVQDMAGYRRWLDAPLREIAGAAEANQDAPRRLRASLALLPVDERQVDYLYPRLLSAELPEVLAIREGLRLYPEQVRERLWGVLEDRQKLPEQRLRAACALAEYMADDGRWDAVGAAVGADVAAALVAQNALAMGHWAEALKPVRQSLLRPLAGILTEEGPDGSQRRAMAQLYAGYAEGQAQALGLLEEVLAEKVGPDAIMDAKRTLARRQANAAAALAAMGQWEKVLPLLAPSPDPTVRSYLIERLGSWAVDVAALNAQREKTRDVSVGRALLLALGDFGKRLQPAERDLLIGPLLKVYENDADPGMHGAAGWLLREWGQQAKLAEIDIQLKTGKPEGGRLWYVNGQGQTMVIVPRPQEEFWLGEGQERQRRRIERSFALAAREVTVAEFRRFRKDHDYWKEGTPTEDCPVNQVSWYDAAAYCNWLSKEEGIAADQWCYLYTAGMKMAPDYLRRTGYRLPTEAEWEYACRAGCATGWSHGDAEELLAKYAWFAGNSLGHYHPVGGLRPNDWGLFDLHGNAWEWCQDRGKGGRAEDGKVIVDAEDQDDIKGIKYNDSNRIEDGRLLRGGAYSYDALNARCADRDRCAPAVRINVIGFRPARTYR